MTARQQDKITALYATLAERWPYPKSGPAFEVLLREVALPLALDPIQIRPHGVGYIWTFTVAGHPYMGGSTNGRLEDGLDQAHWAAIAVMEQFRPQLGVGDFQWIMYEDCMDYLGVPRKKVEAVS